MENRHKHKKKASVDTNALKALIANVSSQVKVTKKLEIPQIQFTIDFMKLHLRCKASVEELMEELGGVSSWANFDAQNNPIPNTLESYAYKDNGSSILAVAHCDTIQGDGGVYPVKLSAETLVFAQKCDDRLGVYTILDLLPSLGVEFDVLLTTNEEKGQSTARLFKTDKKYDWIVEFDRNGTDAVTYDYGDANWHDILDPYFTVNRGSFTDISDMQGLHCKAFNVGVGYHDEHSKRAFFVLDEYIAQINRFMAFYNKYRHTHFPHTKKQVTFPSYPYNGGYYGYGGYNGYNYSFENDYLHTPITHDDEVDVLEDTMHYCPICEEYFYEHDTIKVVEGVVCPYCGETVKDTITSNVVDATSATQGIPDSLRAEIDALKYRSGSNKRNSQIRPEDMGEILPF